MTLPSSDSPLTVVTAADQAYWRCLYQFLRSAERRHLHDRYRFIVYDLGIAAGELVRLKKRFPWCVWRRFAFEDHPPHVALARRTYAWKPIVIAAAVEEAAGPVLWLDSATLLRSDLDAIRKDILRHGSYTLTGQTAVGGHCDPRVWQALGAPLEILHRPERVAGVIGADPKNRTMRAIIAQWRRVADDPGIFLPLSPAHKPEQAVLSLLLYAAERRGELTLNEGDVDISSSRPVHFLTTRNKVPPAFPLWADPFARAYYAAYKTIDRRWIALKQWCARRIDSGRRLPFDHYTVCVASRDLTVTAPVRAPFHSYYADPFLWSEQNRRWLFVEEYLYLEGRGRLCAIELGGDLRAGPPVPILPLDVHASFPFLLRHEGRLYMLPETSAARSIDLYVCERFPDRWSLTRRLVYGVDAADSVLFPHEGRFWLITSLRDTGAANRHLAIFWSDDPVTGAWTPHPVNAARLYADRANGSMRNAGPIVRHGSRLLRPAQNSPAYYGEGLSVMEIVTLTPEAFDERPYAGDHPYAVMAERVSPHHVGIDGECVVFDVRDRVSLAQYLPGRPFGLRPRGRLPGV